MTIEEIRNLGLNEEAVQELTGGKDYINLVRDTTVCPMCGMIDNVWYCAETKKHVCIDCHLVF